MAAQHYQLPTVTAAHVGTFFVGNYYQVLQGQPQFVHQFYSDSSTLLRVDGSSRVTANSMLQIHALVMSLNYTKIDIQTVNSLESWDRGVIVLVSGSVHLQDSSSRRNFVQTFFLAPQENGYFVLNDIFQFVDDQPILHHLPPAFMTQNDLVSKLNGTTAVREPASSYMLGGDIQARDFVPATTVEENGTMNSYSFQEQLQVPETENVLESSYTMQTNGSVKSSVNSLKDCSPPVEEVVGEPQKHTYASILQAAKGHSAPSAPREQHLTTSASRSELNHVSKPPSRQSTAERSGHQADTSVNEDEEVLSVYVRNVPSTATASEIEQEFKKFGKIGKEGVAIRTRKDINVCYAFVEYADITGVNNAIKASTVEIAGHQVFIEGRRENRSNAHRAGRERGRGKGSYPTDGRGRFGGRNHNRGNGHNGNDTRSRGNGNHRQPQRQDRTYSNSHHVSQNGHISSD